MATYIEEVQQCTRNWHTTVMKGGPRCGCGNTGCVESVASEQL